MRYALCLFLLTALILTTPAFGQLKGYQPGGALSIDHLVGVFTFQQSRQDAFVNGYIEFFPDHNFTLVMHVDLDRDRITDEHKIFKGTYKVVKQGAEPVFVIEQEGAEQLTGLSFKDGRVETFSARGYAFTRKKAEAPYFEQSQNVSKTAKALRIQTEPPGAAVFLDGVLVAGNTPLVIEKPPADKLLSIRVEMLDHATRKDTVQLKIDEDHTLSYEMVSGEAELWIATKPWTRVILDGKYKGDAPVKLRDLPAGQHTIELINTGAGVSDKFEIDLPEGEIVKKVIEFTGTIDIYVGRDAKVIDREGKVVGKAPSRGLKLPVGNHSLRLADDKKRMKIIQVRIRLNETTVFNKDWAKLMDWEKN
jgi:PEGA domain